MPQLILIAFAGIGLVAGYRWIRRQLADSIAEAARTEQTAGAVRQTVRDLGPLAWDEASKSYRPVRRD